MKTVAALLSDAANYLGIHASDVANLIVSGAGAAVGIAAAVAAWRAARSTKASVDEMREARLQSVRPSLVAEFYHSRSDVTLLIEAGAPPTVGYGSYFTFSPVIETPSLVLTNVGSGTATDISIDWLRGVGEPMDDVAFSRVEALFEVGGFRLSRNSDVFRLSDPRRLGHWTYFWMFGNVRSSDRQSFLSANDQGTRPFRLESIYAVAMDALADRISANGQEESSLDMRRRTDTISIEYYSTTGEVFSQDFLLTFTCGDVSTYLAGKPVEFDEPWNKLSASVFMSVSAKKKKNEMSPYSRFKSLFARAKKG